MTENVKIGNKMPKSIKIISFNVGLLDVSLFGFSLLKPTDYLEQRSEMIGASLLKQNADIIAIQELYKTSHAAKLLSDLNNVYPYYFRKSTSRLRIDNGLLILSKFPIKENAMTALKSGPWEESIFSSKSILSVQVMLDKKTLLNIVNIHPTSGGLFDTQDSDKNIEFRQIQIEQARKLVEAYDGTYSIILGDFNSGPEIAPSNYQFLSTHGYVDAYSIFCVENGLEPEITWDAKNTLNLQGTHPDSISQRIDHIFISHELVDAVKITNSEVIFKELLVEISSEEKVTLSDHYAIMVEFKLD